VIYDGAETFGVRLALQSLGTQGLKDLDGGERQSLREARPKRFSCELARSMLRGGTDKPKLHFDAPRQRAERASDCRRRLTLDPVRGCVSIGDATQMVVSRCLHHQHHRGNHKKK